MGVTANNWLAGRTGKTISAVVKELLARDKKMYSNRTTAILQSMMVDIFVILVVAFCKVA